MGEVADPAIQLSEVAKTYRRGAYALGGVDLRVERGEIFGLLGPNGAGKSTLVKIIMTIVRPTHARGLILARPLGHRPTLARIGYLPENHRFPRYLTGRQTIEFFSALSRVDRRTRRRRAAELLTVVGMSADADRKVSTYSKGMMQRVGLAQAMAHDPELILLDEPTDGVDPVGRRDIRNVLKDLRRQGRTVFINSHMLSELEMICDRVAILVAGRVARQGTIDDLSAARQRYEIEVASDGLDISRALRAAMPMVRWSSADPAQPPPIPGTAVVERGEMDGGRWVELAGPVVRVGAADPADVQPLIDAIRRAGLVIRRVGDVRPTLEELFMETLAR